MVTADEFRKVMGSFAAGVTVVTTVDPSGEPRGITATAFTALSLDPPLCLICVDKRSRTHRAISTARKYAVNILSDRQEAVSRRFGRSIEDKFAEVDWEPAEDGCPVFPQALAWMECDLVDILPGGDHDIFVGVLLRAKVNGGSPLVYFRGQYGDVTGREET